MSIISEIFRLHRDFDAVALDEVEQMSLRLKSLYDNLNHLKILLGMIEKAKRNGTLIKEAIRENLFQTLNAVKKELVIEMKLEEEVQRVEKAEEIKEEKEAGYYVIRISQIEGRNSENQFLIGSSPECNQRIPGLAHKQVGLWWDNKGNIVIASYGRRAQIMTPSKPLEQIYGTKVTYDKNFDLHLVGSNKIVIVKIRS